MNRIIVGAVVALCGVVLELAKRELGGTDPKGHTSADVSIVGLTIMGCARKFETAAEVVDYIAERLTAEVSR